MTIENPLILAIEAGDAGAVRGAIAIDARTVHQRSKSRPHRMPLHVAAGGTRADFVRILLEAGADPDARDSQHTTPLGVAAFYGRATVAEELIAVGANPSIRNDLGYTPLGAAVAGSQGAWAKYSDAKPEQWDAIVAMLRGVKAEL